MYDELAIELAGARHGVVALWELRNRGVPSAHLRMLRSSRHWEEVEPSVLRRVGSPDSTAQRLATGVLACGQGAVATGLGSARWWGLTGCPQWPLKVIGTRSLRRRPARVEYSQVRRLPPGWTTSLDGVSLGRPELCAMWLFAECSDERAARLVDSLWSMRLLSGPSIGVLLRDMGASGRNGIGGLRSYLEERGPDYVPPASRLEDRAWEILRGVGIVVRRQVNVGSGGAWTGRVDGLVVGTTVVIEVQSWRYHAALVDQVADGIRRRQLEIAGFTVVEITDDEVWSQPAEVVRKVEAAIRLDRAARRSTPRR